MRIKRMKLNPVFYSEMRMRMRGVKTTVLMSIYFVILLVVFVLLYRVIGNDSGYYGYYGYYGLYNSRPRPEGMELLIPMYAVLLFMVYAVIVLMIPALNAGNIAAEREKQTLDLLLLSRMSAIRIVMGKIMSNLAFAGFLLVLALPLFAIVYLFGSIMFLDIVKMFLYMLISVYACSSLATFFSSLVKKTSVATMLTYIALILFAVLTIVIGIYLMERNWRYSYYDGDYEYIPLIMRVNPVFSLMELLAVAEGNANTGSDIMEYFMDDINFSFTMISSIFMLIVSPVLNIASAILIKPVQKFQLRRSKAGAA